MFDFKEAQPFLLALVVGAITAIAARLRPRAQKQKEASDASSSEASSQKGWQGNYEELRVLYLTLAHTSDKQDAQIAKLQRELGELKGKHGIVEAKQRLLAQRQEGYEIHLDDVYASISQEGPDVETRIKGRWKTIRPPKEG